MYAINRWIISIAIAVSLPCAFGQDLEASTNPRSPDSETSIVTSRNTPDSKDKILIEKTDQNNLSNLRGGFDTVSNDQKLNGVVGTNTANNVLSGNNSISSNSFSNSVGIPIVIQNSGANVLIQNSTIINLRMN